MTQQFINEELFRPLKSTKRGGFGIGGYQVRELMRDLGGDVTVESIVGQGTRVTLVPAARPETAVNDPIMNHEKGRTRSAAPPAAQAEQRVLLVEDDVGLQKQMRWALSPYAVDVAGSRAEAVGKISASKPFTSWCWIWACRRTKTAPAKA